MHCKLRERAFEIETAAVQPLVGREFDRDLVAVPQLRASSDIETTYQARTRQRWQAALLSSTRDR